MTNATTIVIDFDRVPSEQADVLAGVLETYISRHFPQFKVHGAMTQDNSDEIPEPLPNTPPKDGVGVWVATPVADAIMSGDILFDEVDPRPVSLTECVNWETNKRGNCGGRLFRRGDGSVNCENCANLRHFYNVAENDPTKSNCGMKGGLIRMTSTNVNCPDCLR